MTDLWPHEFELTETKAPSAILREQASLLAGKTQGAVVADVEIQQSDDGPDFEYAFLLRAPEIDYRHKLFVVRHALNLYPAALVLDPALKKEIFDGKKEKVVASTESEFLIILKKIFHSDRTKRVVASLLNQTK
jgi:hypothetical protein